MTTTRPFALRLFVPSGLPEGMRIVEKTNWSGIGYVIPRSQLKEFTQRPEAGRPGVYVLTGPDPEDGGADLAYIGEADPLGRRLEQHQVELHCPKPQQPHSQSCPHGRRELGSWA